MDDHQIGRVESLQAGNVTVLIGIDLAAARVDFEQYRAGKAMMIGQDLRQLRQILPRIDTPRPPRSARCAFPCPGRPSPRM